MLLKEIKNIHRGIISQLCESQNLTDYSGNIHAMKNGATFLYRGMTMHPGMTNANLDDLSAYYATPRDHERTPKGNTLAGAVADSIPGIPRRSLSSFATSDLNNTVMFGDPWLIIPNDHVKLYGYIDRDFNYTSGVATLAVINNLLYGLYNGAVYWTERTKYTGEEFNKMKSILDSIPLDNRRRPEYNHPRTIAGYDFFLNELPKWEDRITDDSFSGLLEDIESLKLEMQKYNVNTIGDLLKAFNADFFGIKTATSLSEIPDGMGEVFFEGGYLAVKMDEDDTAEGILDKLINEIGK